MSDPSQLKQLVRQRRLAPRLASDSDYVSNDSTEHLAPDSEPHTAPLVTASCAGRIPSQIQHEIRQAIRDASDTGTFHKIVAALSRGALTRQAHLAGISETSPHTAIRLRASEWGSLCASVNGDTATACHSLLSQIETSIGTKRLFVLGDPVKSPHFSELPAEVVDPSRFERMSRAWANSTCWQEVEHPGWPVAIAWADSHCAFLDNRPQTILPKMVLHPAQPSLPVVRSLLPEPSIGQVRNSSASLPLRLAVEIATLVPPQLRHQRRSMIELPPIRVGELFERVWPPNSRTRHWKRLQWPHLREALIRVADTRFEAGEPLIKLRGTLPPVQGVTLNDGIKLSVSSQTADHGPRISRPVMREMAHSFGRAWLLMLRIAAYWDRVAVHGATPKPFTEDGDVNPALQRLGHLTLNDLLAMSRWEEISLSQTHRRQAVKRLRETLCILADTGWLFLHPVRGDARGDVYGLGQMPSRGLQWGKDTVVQVLPAEWWGAGEPPSLSQ